MALSRKENGAGRIIGSSTDPSAGRTKPLIGVPSRAGTVNVDHQILEVRMTRTDLTASSRPQAATATSQHTMLSRRGLSPRLLALPAALALMLPAAPALAAEGTSNYNQTPPATTPSTTTPTPKPSSGTGPSTSSSPAKHTTTTTPAPSTSGTLPASSGHSTLPFTGLDLRWIVLGGVLLMAGGLTIRVAQRR